MTTLKATKSLFAIEIANEISAQDDNNPILSRVLALTVGVNSTNEMTTYAIRTGDVTTDVIPENVARRWMVGVKTTKKTLNVTTQRGVLSIPNPATRRFKTQMAHLQYPRMSGMFYVDIMEPKVLSLESQRYAHVIGNGCGFVKVYPMARKNKSFNLLCLTIS
jgi:hypothetical protein